MNKCNNYFSFSYVLYSSGSQPMFCGTLICVSGCSCRCTMTVLDAIRTYLLLLQKIKVFLHLVYVINYKFLFKWSIISMIYSLYL